MKLKLFKKYFFATVMIIIFSLTVMMLILSVVLNNYIAKSTQKTLTSLSNEVIGYIDILSPEEDDRETFYGFLKTVSDVADVDIFITDTTGKILICGCEEWQNEESCIHSAVIISREELGIEGKAENFRISSLNIYKMPHYVASARHYKDGAFGGTVFVTSSTTLVKELLSNTTKLYFTATIIPIIIMFFAIYAMTYRLTKPLKLMSEASKAMAKGDFSKRIPVMSDDEIGDLSASFNMMTNSLSRLEGMRKSFVADVSHELKTPMTSIGGFIDGILDGTIEPEKHEYYLNIVSEEIKRLSRLVQSMLSMARLEAGEFNLKPELFDLREMLFTVVISQERRIEEQKLQIVGLDELQGVSVNADRDLIHQVLYNLVDNAIKFTETGGSLSFVLKVENKKTVLIITNTGKGIPEKDLPFIFERFYKVDKSRATSKNSTGIGLYIVKTIVAAHGGNIEVKSKENEFTAFKITLPSAQ